jgi:hypothetical protein
MKTLRDKANALRDWLEQHCPRCGDEQAHLVQGTAERSYWHYGYLSALRDVLRLSNRTSCSRGSASC